MRLTDYLQNKFFNGIPYEDAAQLCLSIYCAKDIFPHGVVDDELSLENIADAFSNIAILGFIKNYSLFKSVTYGANYHSIQDKGHWVEVQASALKLNTTYDLEYVKALIA